MIDVFQAMSITSPPLRVAFYTLGCKLNFSETSTIARQFADQGYVRVQPTEQADVYVINTCSVTEQANRKCRQAIHRFMSLAPQAKMVVTGCYAQLQPQQLSQIEGVSLVVGQHEKANIPALLAAMDSDGKIRCASIERASSCLPAFSLGDRTRSFLKVQDGCNYRCSYCTIPLARGHSRNLPIAQVVEQARAIAQRGVKEIILTGVNTGDFGRSTGERFPDLLRALVEVQGVERLRVSSIEPNLLTDEVLEVCLQSPKLLPHFHIPLQSGSDRVLGLMRRRYRSELFAQRVERVRELMPQAFVGVDVIVGFPSETEADFEASRQLLESLHVSYLHVFPYSPRPNTPAAQMPDQVPAAVSRQRVDLLTELSKRLHEQFCDNQRGTSHSVLWESARRNGQMFGFTENYIKVAAPYNKMIINTIQTVTLGDYYPDGYCIAQ